MNNNVYEIISILIQKILYDDDLFIEEEEIIQELLDFGYDIQDIDQAFELIYNSTEIIEEEDLSVNNFKEVSNYNRILTDTEKLFLPLDLQGLLRKLIVLRLLTPLECEELITKLIRKGYYSSTLPSDFWNILEEIVDDQNKLEHISSEIPEFKNLLYNNFKYVN